MAKFKVLISRTFLTEIEVEAVSRTAARRQIENYGPDLATQDYPAVDLETDAKVKAVRTAQ